ncbi:MAG TPA: hypothetical protein VFN74_08770 [Chloroflexota bacterium]|nr:hypothetical protein [Chloroflexota bacterium]
MFRVARRLTSPTPLGAAGRGLLAGLGASLLLSFLARVLPGMENVPAPAKPPDKKDPPQDPFDPRAVREWQAQGQAPAAHDSPEDSGQPRAGGTREGIAAATPAGALAQPTAPGPEGLAEQFAFKIASGVFGVDLAPHARAAGIGTHLLYGSSWGVLYGLVQGTVRQPPTLTGPLFGLFVWLIGPALLVPAMRLMRAPHREPPVRTSMLIAGHVAYGLTVAGVYEALER